MYINVKQKLVIESETYFTKLIAGVYFLYYVLFGCKGYLCKNER